MCIDWVDIGKYHNQDQDGIGYPEERRSKEYLHLAASKLSHVFAECFIIGEPFG